jgi:hypothetical protein
MPARKIMGCAMRRNRSGDKLNDVRASRLEPMPSVLPTAQDPTFQIPKPPPQTTAVAHPSLFGCSALTQHFTLAFHAEGVPAQIVCPTAEPADSTIVISADDKQAAVDVLLRELNCLQSAPVLNLGPTTALAA